jgi:hypothetical protein
MLAELATLEAEMKELERAIEKIGDLPPPPAAPKAPPRSSIDDQLDQMKRGAGNVPPPKQSAPKKPASSTVDDELAALKKKMAQNAGAPKKKP